jgi:hypothetical protein
MIGILENYYDNGNAVLCKDSIVLITVIEIINLSFYYLNNYNF